MSKVLVETRDLKKSFVVGNQEVEVLKGIDLQIEEGEFAVLFGPSGCGKSTLLHTLLGLEPPSLGKVIVGGKNFYEWNEDQRANFRKENMSTIFQQPLWIRALNVVENVGFPLRLVGKNGEEAERAALKTLKMVGMESWAGYLPTELSAGQQQKVSLARALTIDPMLLAADEPTGNLDTSSGEELMQILADLSSKGKTVFMITHDLEYLKYASKLMHMIDGKIVEIYDQKKNGVRKVGNGKKFYHRGEGLTVHDSEFLKKLKKLEERK